ncbi:uncharacterized protein LOC128549102 [Mercenaria mercenaria]|uniref:uncharacterized protein LOC128549102 n=1 Tax=Mercenaria mercenaria TaxID=6596 RepID=UPI00234F4FA5|nr:uncharacterized protein LOC128549102 [Mercenaria mercenaria]
MEFYRWLLLGTICIGFIVVYVYIVHGGIYFGFEFIKPMVDIDLNTSNIFKERQSQSSAPAMPAFVKVSGTKAYLLSAVFKSKLDENNRTGLKGVRNGIVVTGWYAPVNSKPRYGPLSCCFYHENGGISSGPAERRNSFKESERDLFDVLQCVCPIQDSNKGPVTKVSIVEVDDVCTNNTDHYIDAENIPNRKINGTALCAKIMYGSLDAGFLIE